MSDDPRIQYKFMIPESLKTALEDAAHDNRRSLSAEIIARLQASFEVPSPQMEQFKELIGGMISKAVAEAIGTGAIKDPKEFAEAHRKKRRG